jgi:hypothetical protein
MHFRENSDEAEKVFREGRAEMQDCEGVLTDWLVDYGV